MNKYDYFIRSMKHQAHYSRNWMLRVFSVVLNDIHNGDTKWMLRHTPEHVEVCVPDANGNWTWEILEDCKPYEIPYIYHEVIAWDVQPGDVENVTKVIKNATWGDLLVNSRLIVYSCGDRLEYREGPIDLGALQQAILDVMISDVPVEKEDPKQIYVKHYRRFGKATADLAGYEMFVPSVTEKALQAPADNKEMRDALFDQYKGQLDDPVVQVKIQEALVKNYVDKQIKGDPSEGFLYKTKSLNTALKRMFLIHGPEAGFSEGGRAVLVPTSLEEGVNLKYYPEMVNSLRAGSYYRGALTAMAGEDVDLMSRIFQNAKIAPGFCGTTDTYDRVIEKRHIGRTLNEKGKLVKITKENIGEYANTVRSMYSPMYCKTGHGDVCSTCMSDKVSAYPDSLGSMMAEIPSTMMQVMMGSAHAKQLKTTPLVIEKFLR